MNLREKYPVSKEREKYIELIAKIIDLRKEKKITQEELGKKVNLTQPQIARIENFMLKPKLETIVNIVLALDGNIDIL